MRESERKPAYDQWVMDDERTVTLGNPVAAIGAGHLDAYLADPEGVFCGLGIAIKMTLPDAVLQAFERCRQRGETLRVRLTHNGARKDFVLVYDEEGERYPWRLAGE